MPISAAATTIIAVSNPIGKALLFSLYARSFGFSRALLSVVGVPGNGMLTTFGEVLSPLYTGDGTVGWVGTGATG